MLDKAGAATSVQELANKIKMILSNPDLLARLAEQETEDGSVSALLDELDEGVSNLEKLYPNAE
jgi:hypothetical protein